MNDFLGYLIPDDTHGYLYPRTQTQQALGATTGYQICKHQRHLVENEHYLKQRGADHVDRIFFTLKGLLVLCDLVATPAAQTFKQAVIEHIKEGGALVKATPTPLSYEPSASVDPSTTSPIPTFAPASPAGALAHHLRHELQPAIEQSVKRAVGRSQLAHSSAGERSPQDAAQLVFDAQRVASELIEQGYRYGNGQALSGTQVAPQKPSEVHVTVNLFERIDGWLDQQDRLAVNILTVLLVVATGLLGAFIASLMNSSSNPPAETTRQL